MARSVGCRVAPLLTLTTCFNALLCLPPGVFASPAPGDSAQFCGQFDYEQWRRDHPLPAGKRAADLNAGEPRTVRMIYFLPKDRPFRQEVVDSMRSVIRRTQAFYAEQMEAHGHGSFLIETDADGAPQVHRVDGRYGYSHYKNDTMGDVMLEVEPTFDFNQNVYLIVVDHGDAVLFEPGGGVFRGVAVPATKNGGVAMVPAAVLYKISDLNPLGLNVTAHELGHVFGLEHDFRDRRYIMSYGNPLTPILSGCSAGFLTAHPYFDPAVPIEAGDPPVIDLQSSTEIPAGQKSVSLRLKLRDEEGLRRVILLSHTGIGGVNFEVLGCRNLADGRDGDAVFEYDGYSPYWADYGQIKHLSDRDAHSIKVTAVDTDGDVRQVPIELTARRGPDQPLPSSIEIVSGDRQQGVAGSVLPNPLVVLVRDQNGNPLPGATIQFSVVEGRALFNGRYSVETVKSDDSGRAATTLTLGDNPGTVLLRVSAPTVPVSICRPESASLFAVETPNVPIQIDNPATWRLPIGGVARLGKGTIGTGDRAVAFSPVGRRMAVASGVGVWLYDSGFFGVTTSRPRSLLPSIEPVHSVAFSSDGTQLAAGKHKGMIDLWDVASERKVAELGGESYHRYKVLSLAFSRDGTRLASGSWEQVVVLWDVPGRREIHTWSYFKQDTSLKPVSVAFSPNGAVLAAGFKDGTVRLLDVATGGVVAELSGHRLGVRSVAFSPDGTTVASGSEDGTVKLWDAARRVALKTLSGHTGVVTSVSFRTDGKAVVSGSYGDVRVWDVATGLVTATLTGGNTSLFSSISLSPDGSTIASGSTKDGEILLWDVYTRNAVNLGDHEEVGRSVSFSPNGKTLATSSSRGSAKLWDAKTGRLLRSFGLRDFGIRVVAISPDGFTLAAGSSDNSVSLFNVVSGEQIGYVKPNGKGQMLSLAFSPDGETLAAGQPNGVTLWDVAGGSDASPRVISDLIYDITWIWSLAYSPDGKVIAAGDGSGKATLLDASSLTHIATLGTHNSGEVKGLSFSPDGRTLAVAHGNVQEGIALWDVANKEKVAGLPWRGWLNIDVSFSPSGSILAASFHDGTVALWDVASRVWVAKLNDGHTTAVHSLAFSPDGETLASGAEDGTVLLWDIPAIIGPKPQVPISRADFDGDGVVGFADFVLFAREFGLSSGDAVFDARFDLDQDGAVGFSDFVIFAGRFGQGA